MKYLNREMMSNVATIFGRVWSWDFLQQTKLLCSNEDLINFTRLKNWVEILIFLRRSWFVIRLASRNWRRWWSKGHHCILSFRSCQFKWYNVIFPCILCLTIVLPMLIVLIFPLLLASVTLVITVLGADFTRLESFGKVDAFAETLVGFFFFKDLSPQHHKKEFKKEKMCSNSFSSS